VRLTPGSYLRITDDLLDLDDTRPPVPEIRRSDLRASASSTELKNDVALFTGGQTMANLYDVRTGRYVWLVAPTSGLLTTSPGVFQICGHEAADPLSRRYAVFYGEAVARIGSSKGLR
jgi:hypothetical protein